MDTTENKKDTESGSATVPPNTEHLKRAPKPPGKIAAFIAARKARFAALLVKTAAKLAPHALRVDPVLAAQMNRLTAGRILTVRQWRTLDNRPLNEMQIMDALRPMIKRDCVTFWVHKEKGKKPVLVGDVQILRERPPAVRQPK